MTSQNPNSPVLGKIQLSFFQRDKKAVLGIILKNLRASKVLACLYSYSSGLPNSLDHFKESRFWHSESYFQFLLKFLHGHICCLPALDLGSYAHLHVWLRSCLGSLEVWNRASHSVIAGHSLLPKLGSFSQIRRGKSPCSTWPAHLPGQSKAM